MNDSDDPDDSADEPVDRDEWLAAELDSSWKHLAGGDFACGPTSSLVDIFVRVEEDLSYSLRFFGEGLEADDPPLELESESYQTAQEVCSALAERGITVSPDDLA